MRVFGKTIGNFLQYAEKSSLLEKNFDINLDMPKIQFLYCTNAFPTLLSINELHKRSGSSLQKWKYSSLQLFYCTLTVHMYLQCGVIPVLLIPVIYTVSLSG